MSIAVNHSDAEVLTKKTWPRVDVQETKVTKSGCIQVQVILTSCPGIYLPFGSHSPGY
jgi:hypothetical protein